MASAYEYALNLLSARAYTARNIRRKLERKGFAGDDVGDAVARLEGAGLIDDAKFAAEFARQRLTTGGSSVRRVKQDLARMGISAGEIQTAVGGVLENESVDELRSIGEAARKKLVSMGGLADEVKRRRLFAFLARRGFEISDIQRVMRECLAR